MNKRVFSEPVIVNILGRRRDPAPVPLLQTPATLQLAHAPVADCARPDRLIRID